MKNSTRQKYSTETISRHINSWEASGKSRKMFAEETGLNYYTFCNWIKQHQHNNSSAKGIGFTQLSFPSIPSVFAELHMGRKNKVIFYQPFPAEYLQRLR